jgi:hypothetical protein
MAFAVRWMPVPKVIMDDRIYNPYHGDRQKLAQPSPHNITQSSGRTLNPRTTIEIAGFEHRGKRKISILREALSVFSAPISDWL